MCRGRCDNDTLPARLRPRGRFANAAVGFAQDQKSNEFSRFCRDRMRTNPVRVIALTVCGTPIAVLTAKHREPWISGAPVLLALRSSANHAGRERPGFIYRNARLHP